MLYKGFTTNKWWPLTTLNRWLLYRIKIYSKTHRESMKVKVMSRWPLYKGDRYDRFDCISVISWRSVLLVEENIVPGENHRPVESHWQILSHNAVSSTPHLSGIRTHNFSQVMGTDWVVVNPNTIRSRPWRPRFCGTYFDIIISPLVEKGLYCNHLVHPSVCPFVHPFTLSLKMSQLLLKKMILFLIHDFSIVTCTMSPLSRLTAHLLPVYLAT